MYGWITQIIIFHVWMDYTNNYISCTIGIHKQLDFMYVWNIQTIGFHVCLEYTNNWISCMNGLHK
jgi:hypothetical protein